MSNRVRVDWLYALLTAGIALLVFLFTLAPTVTAEDSGELIAAAWFFGIPHPPGYPLWTMLCGVFLHLFPFGSIAYRANLFSALCSAAAAAAVYGALRELGVSRPIAASSGLVWILGRWSWSQSVVTEVYGLNSLLTAGLLWCVLRWYRTRTTRSLLVASLLLGLGMSNHHTIGLAGLAVGVWILLLAPALLRQWTTVLGCVGLFLVGLVPYVYLPVRARAEPVMNWGNPSTFHAFWEHVSRHQYGAIGPTAAGEPRALGRLVKQLGYVGESLADDLTVWLLVIAMAGIVMLAVRRRDLLLLALLWMAGTGVLFVLLANFDLDRTSRWVMRVFLIPVSLGLVIPMAMVLERVVEMIRARLAPRRIHTALLVGGIALVGPAIQVASHWRACDYSDYWYAYDHAENELTCMMRGAMLFPSGDHNTFPLVYVHFVEGQRPDIVIADMYGYVDPALCRDRPEDDPDTPMAWLIKHARRPVYFATKRPSPVSNARLVPAGLLYHLLPEGKPFNAAGLIEQCTYRNHRVPTVLDFGASHINFDYAFFRGLAALERGDRLAALDHFRKANQYVWGIREAPNNIGSALAEHGMTDEAAAYFRMAADIDPRYLTPRWNLFRIAEVRADWAYARSILQELIDAAPENYRSYAEMGFLLRDRFGDIESAMAYWRRSLRINPDQPEVVKAIAEGGRAHSR